MIPISDESFGEESSPSLSEEDIKAIRENAKRILHESGCAEMLRSLNSIELKGRGWFDEYDSGVIFKWGTGYTRRHIWIHVEGDNLQFRLRPHRKCTENIPSCDGEYHTFTPENWAKRNLVLAELKRNYEHPSAESSDD